jgi:hypothetical protein
VAVGTVGRGDDGHHPVTIVLEGVRPILAHRDVAHRAVHVGLGVFARLPIGDDAGRHGRVAGNTRLAGRGRHGGDGWPARRCAGWHWGVGRRGQGRGARRRRAGGGVAVVPAYWSPGVGWLLVLASRPGRTQKAEGRKRGATPLSLGSCRSCSSGISDMCPPFRDVPSALPLNQDCCIIAMIFIPSIC